jgi:Holliday junction resolvase RusA-like endonuclease
VSETAAVEHRATFHDVPRLSVSIAGEPCAQGRPKFARIGQHVRAYDPKKSRDWKAYAVACVEGALMARGITGIAFPEGPLKVFVTAVFTCPKGDHRKVSVPRRLHAKRPDAENVGKAVLDMGTTAGLWQDDAQVADLRIMKIIGAQGEAPYVQLQVERA